MTAGPTPPAPPPAHDEPLVVRTDRRLVGRLVWRGNIPLVLAMLVCVGIGGALGAVVGSSAETDLSVTLGALFGVLAALLGFLAGLSVFLFASVLHMVHREVDVMAVVDPAGLHVAVPGTNAGSAFLPWSAIASVSSRGRGHRRVLVVRAVPGVSAVHPGSRGLDDGTLMTALRSNGLRIRTGTALVPHDVVVAAVEHFRARAAATGGTTVPPGAHA